MPTAFAASMKSFDIAASAIDMPPDAEPVMPASEVTVTASRTSGLGIAPSASRMARKPGREAITPPKPYSVAVFIAASSAPATAALLPSAKVLDSGRKASRKTSDDADEQRALDRPDRADRLDRRRDRVVHGELEVVARAVGPVDQAGECRREAAEDDVEARTPRSAAGRRSRATADGSCRPAAGSLMWPSP